MGLAGILGGAGLGFFFGGPLGALFGALLGNRIEKEVKAGSGSTARRAGQAFARAAGANANASLVFCASAAAMLAKMAKADGCVTRTEIASVEQAFARLGFSPQTRRFAQDVFRKAKDDDHTIYEYAAEFAEAVPSVEVRELFYELLWDLACSDGVLAPEEHAMLRGLPASLRISPNWYSLFARDRIRGGGASGRSSSPPPPSPADELAAAYRLLGVDASAEDAAVKRAYREKAKKYHPDTMRAQGLPEEMVGKATEMMGKINAAWATIRQARGMK